MKLEEMQGTTGRLIIKKYNLAGEMEQEVTVKNDITKAGRDLLARLFDNAKAGSKIERVSKIRFGKSGEPFKTSQTALLDYPEGWETPIDKIEQDNDASPDRVILRLTGELDETECNGPIKEAGLFTDDNVMYNRVVFKEINKSDQFRFTLIWEITF